MQTLTRKTFQKRDNSWFIVFEDAQLAATVDVPSGDPNEQPIEVNLLHNREIGNRP